VLRLDQEGCPFKPGDIKCSPSTHEKVFILVTNGINWQIPLQENNETIPQYLERNYIYIFHDHNKALENLYEKNAKLLMGISTVLLGWNWAFDS